jgi:hypothetical protein
MRYLRKLAVTFLCMLGFNQSVNADPWFTGPLLAPAGHTVPRGHTNFEFYGLDVLTNGAYNSFGQVNHSPLFRTMVANPILTHGFADWLDVQLTLPYVYNTTRNASHHRLADTALAIGIQLLEQNKSPTRMDVRILLQETFPTGRYNHLNPNELGTDSSGLGSYQTQYGLNFQYLLHLYNSHYLRTRLILSRLYARPVEVHGLNSYGGTVGTSGKINPGSENYLDWAFEYTLTQNWVAVLEGTYSTGKATRFNGVLKIGNIGSPSASIGSGDYNETALAPALEYNFNGNIGLIGGVWFPISGKNTSHYMTYVLALNTYW